MARAARALSTDRQRAGPAGPRDGVDGPADTCDRGRQARVQGGCSTIWLIGLGGHRYRPPRCRWMGRLSGHVTCGVTAARHHGETPSDPECTAVSPGARVRATPETRPAGLAGSCGPAQARHGHGSWQGLRSPLCQASAQLPRKLFFFPRRAEQKGHFDGPGAPSSLPLPSS